MKSGNDYFKKNLRFSVVFLLFGISPWKAFYVCTIKRMQVSCWRMLEINPFHAAAYILIRNTKCIMSSKGCKVTLIVLYREQIDIKTTATNNEKGGCRRQPHSLHFAGTKNESILGLTHACVGWQYVIRVLGPSRYTRRGKTAAVHQVSISFHSLLGRSLHHAHSKWALNGLAPGA